MAQSAGAVEYTNCFSTEEQHSPNECPGYQTKQSDGEVPLMVELWGLRDIPFIIIFPESTMARYGSNK